MSQREREFRSKLAKLIHEGGILRGTLTRRQRTCGRPTCRCAKGEKHASLYVVFKEEAKYRQIYVPKELEELVTAWVANHQRARELLEEISRVHREKVLKRDI